MKGFNRKWLIPSLAASAILAAATLAPLPGLLTTVQAAPPNYIAISNPVHINVTIKTGLNGINIPLTYTCATGSTAAAIVVTVALQTGGGSGSTGTFLLGSPIPVTCNGLAHQVSANIFPDAGTSFIVGTASVTTEFIDNTNTIVGTPSTATVRVDA